MMTRRWASAPSSAGGEPIVNSPAGITTIGGQSVQSLNSVRASGTLRTAGGAARRCGDDSASRRAGSRATSSAVLALSSAIWASRSVAAVRACSLACAWDATEMIAQAMSLGIRVCHKACWRPAPRTRKTRKPHNDVFMTRSISLTAVILSERRKYINTSKTRLQRQLFSQSIIHYGIYSQPPTASFKIARAE